MPLDDLALDVAGRRARRQVDLGQVALVEPDEVLRQPRRRPEQDEQEPGRERVERPGVAGARAGAVAQPLDDRERRRPRRLVDEDEPRGAKTLAAACDAANAERMNSMISSIDVRAREARRLPVTAAATLPGDRGDVDLVRSTRAG